MINVLCGALLGTLIGLVFFPQSFGKTLAQIRKGYLKEIDND